MSEPRRRRLLAWLTPGPGAPDGAAAAPARSLVAGRAGAGGYYAAWDAASADAAAARHLGVQYAGARHQAGTALSGMWLFLATELLFFGALFFIYGVNRSLHPAGTAEAARQTELAIGTINTVLLLTSSAVFAYALGCARQGRDRALVLASLVTAGLGAAFLGLKGYEWLLDFDKHRFPGAGFVAAGADAGGAALFWCFYFIATGLHGLHMLAGIVLVLWIAWTARSGRYSAAYVTPVEAVGLYWSFVDMVWLVLYPALYLAGGAR